MSVDIDETRLPLFERASWKWVLRDEIVIGRIKRLRDDGEGDLTREWFTAECMIEGKYMPLAGAFSTIDKASECIVMYAAAQYAPRSYLSSPPPCSYPALGVQ